MLRIRFGEFDFDARLGELRKGARRLKVPHQSMDILDSLLARAGDLVTREELCTRLWPSKSFGDFEHGLNAAVRRLREALGDSAERPKFIETLPSRGYRFIGAVERVPTEPASPHPPLRLATEISVLHFVIVGSIVLAFCIGLWIGRSERLSAPASDAHAQSRMTPVVNFLPSKR